MRRLMTMRAALENPEVFGTILPGETWAAWRVVLIASQGEPLTDAERVIYRELTGGREREPDRPVRELWAVMGRRAGKTRAMACAAAYFAGLIDYTGDLAPGQRGRVPIMAAAKDTAREAFNYLLGIFTEVPLFAELVEGEPTQDTIRLQTKIDIQVMAANFKTVRGPTPVCAIADEIAFWSIEGSANPDEEVLRALRPGLGTLGSPLLVLSSPYARKGMLWKVYRKHFGPDGSPRVLVLQAPTQTMHKSETLAEEEAEAYDADPAAAAAEWGAQFRKDVEAFVTVEAVAACMDNGVRERKRIDGVRYRAFVDVAGGGADAMTLAIAHLNEGIAVLDLIREEPVGTSPASVAKRFCETMKEYGISEVTGDRYAKEWAQERFRDNGVTYKESEKTKSDIYGAFLPILNSEGCRLIQAPKLEAQLVSLERRTSRGTGKDVIDHPQMKNAHDDVANAACGAIVLCKTGKSPLVVTADQAKFFGAPTRPTRNRNRYGSY